MTALLDAKMDLIAEFVGAMSSITVALYFGFIVRFQVWLFRLPKAPHPTMIVAIRIMAALIAIALGFHLLAEVQAHPDW